MRFVALGKFAGKFLLQLVKIVAGLKKRKNGSFEKKFRMQQKVAFPLALWPGGIGQCVCSTA
jgi:hypothetical protein